MFFYTGLLKLNGVNRNAARGKPAANRNNIKPKREFLV
jgi:hypothetical protein